MLVLAISENLNELFQNCSVTSIASLCELGRIMVMAVDFALVLVVAVLCSEHSRTY